MSNIYTRLAVCNCLSFITLITLGVGGGGVAIPSDGYIGFDPHSLSNYR